MGRRTPTRKSEHRSIINRQRHHYDELLEFQEGGCAICGRPPATRRLAFDHDHKTMEVRGLLCFRCNSMLRTWVTLQWLGRAASYLADPPFARFVKAKLARGETLERPRGPQL